MISGIERQNQLVGREDVGQIVLKRPEISLTRSIFGSIWRHLSRLEMRAVEIGCEAEERGCGRGKEEGEGGSRWEEEKTGKVRLEAEKRKKNL